jgi:hypothetical protein
MRICLLFILLISLMECAVAEERSRGREGETKSTIRVAFTLDELKSCKVNSDCTRVAGGCCGCGGGGADSAINRQYTVVWSRHLTDACKELACIAMMSNHWTCKATPICEQGQCTLK